MVMTKEIPKKEQQNFCNKQPHLKVFDYVRDKLFVKCINIHMYSQILKDVPHMTVGDFALVYCIIIDKDGKTPVSLLINNSHLKMMGITQRALHKAAMKNASTMFPATVENIVDVLGGLIDLDLVPDDDADLYVVKAVDGVYGSGSAALFYPGMMENIADKLGGSYFIIPSSIHEFLVIKDNGQLTGEEIREMIVDINDSEVVSQEEILGDKAYYYDASNHEFGKAE